MGRSCWQTILVSGKRRVPAPPARRMAFLFIYLALGLRSFFHAPAHQQFRPFPPKTCACGQIDPKLFTDQSDRFSRSRPECTFIEEDGTIALTYQYTVAQS